MSYFIRPAGTKQHTRHGFISCGQWLPLGLGSGLLCRSKSHCTAQTSTITPAAARKSIAHLGTDSRAPTKATQESSVHTLKPQECRGTHLLPTASRLCRKCTYHTDTTICHNQSQPTALLLLHNKQSKVNGAGTCPSPRTAQTAPAAAQLASHQLS